MRGEVRFINTEDDVVAVETEHGEYCVFGLLGEYEIALGDIVSGALERLDQQVFTNETRGIEMQVYVEDAEITREDAQAKIG